MFLKFFHLLIRNQQNYSLNLKKFLIMFIFGKIYIHFTNNDILVILINLGLNWFKNFFDWNKTKLYLIKIDWFCFISIYEFKIHIIHKIQNTYNTKKYICIKICRLLVRKCFFSLISEKIFPCIIDISDFTIFIRVLFGKLF